MGLNATLGWGDRIEHVELVQWRQNSNCSKPNPNLMPRVQKHTTSSMLILFPPVEKLGPALIQQLEEPSLAAITQ